ncbi:unnamed protein product [Parnassius apollo]|uniref:(apollo) hypothetical protein n=1 Tax=Parnassius apollo TaxID=110799 RepID=A0A8S3W7J6_PARAO|nr:unnamed protein product [Parnassius apollo]
MEDLLGIISLLEEPTAILKSDIIQEVLIKIKKINIQTDRTDDYLLLYDKLLQTLWGHLQSELKELDDQLLCSTCFYIILSIVEKQEHFLKLILQNINEELNKRNESNRDNSTIMRTVSIIYGLFQSSFLSQKDNQNEAVLVDILNSVFDLLIHMAYEYSHYTFLTFKIIVSLKKVCGTSLQDVVFTRQNQLKLLNLVNHNWENPINGIRNLNRSIFQTIVSVMDGDIYEEILRKINSFCWNKAKYLMLSEVIEQYTDNVVILIKQFNLVDGLLHSLHKPGLVSAGADMYYSLLKKIYSDEEWREIFLNSIIQILNCSSQKAIENFNNYWCLTTLKKFPSLSTLIINVLQKCENSEKKMFGTLCLIRQSNRLNLIVKDWSQITDIEQLVICGIEHCNPYIRMSAFDIVCVTHEILESTSSQFVWEKGISTSSDFSKMNDMVQQIIDKSGYTTSNDEDETKITGLQQIVLNCLWLNVKASCELASLILKYHNSDKHLAICEKSLYVITKVLETSRHKGAIEAAGVALGEAIQNLTSLPAECQLSKLPLSLLKQKLNELLMEANNMASVTRRGAGLSIMVHSIVSNDKKKNKPLFHYFVNTLLDTCKALQDDSVYFENISNVNNEKDLPKAIYIHFLTRIVTDSSLTTEVMYYSAKLAELAFGNLTSSHWQIRNAALQLYGALIPKLIGQKKASGSEDEVAATVACDEFRTHFPQLWRFISDQLKCDQKKDVLLSHSNFLPILNILGNIAKRYNFFNHFENEIDADDLLNSLVALLGSPIFTVRRLTADSIFNIYSFDNIFEILEKAKQVNENCLHGYLLLLVKCNNHYKNTTCQSKLDILKTKFKTVLDSRMHSYMCRELLESICNETYNFGEILSEIKNHSNEPGKFQWANTHIRKCLLNCEWAEIPHWLYLILDSREYEKHCEILCSKIDSQDVDSVVFKKITDIFLAFPKKMSSNIIWKILYKISLLTNINNNLDIKDITEYLKDNISYKLRYIIPFAARITFEQDILLALSKIIHKLCNAEESDIEMRIIAAKANNEIAHKLSKLPDEIKIVSIITAVILLQDENEDVRSLSVYFYKNSCKMSSLVHPYICLRSILDDKFLRSVFSDPSSGINSILEGLLNLLPSLSSQNMDNFNPFTNESKNIYQEVTVIKYLIANLKKGL